MNGPPTFDRGASSGSQQSTPPARSNNVPPAPAAPASSDPGTRPSLLVRSGANSLLVGFFGGLFGALLGVSLTWLFAGSASGDARQVTLAGIVPALLGACIAGWADASASSWARAGRQMARGGLVGAVAGLVGFGLADVVFDLVASASTDLALVLGWAIVAALIGLGLGLLRSAEKAVVGLLGGLCGGFAGGLAMLAMGVTQRASFWPMLVAVTCASVFVGLAIGGAERVSRRVWIDVLDGPLGGREFPIDNVENLIGSAASAEIHLGLDDLVASRHARLVVSDMSTTIEALEGAVYVAGQQISGPTDIGNEQVSIGSTHFVVRRRE